MAGAGDDFDSENDESDDHDSGVRTAPVTKSRSKTPSMYRVLLLNDDFTPMDFVIHVLQKFFLKNMNDATTIMLQVHQQGAGVAGVFTYEIAETKVYQVNQAAKQNEHPLKCTLEKV
jgi:ATP-dependent Clp protease adaptor protein ClpS